jgi:micrococcal nuclease
MSVNYNYNAKVGKVIDGDSVILLVDVGFRLSIEMNIRLTGINAPELNSVDDKERFVARQAKEYLQSLLPVGSKVVIKTSKPRKDKFGKWQAEIVNNFGVNVGEALVAEKLASRIERVKGAEVMMGVDAGDVVEPILEANE